MILIHFSQRRLLVVSLGSLRSRHQEIRCAKRLLKEGQRGEGVKVVVRDFRLQCRSDTYEGRERLKNWDWERRKESQVWVGFASEYRKVTKVLARPMGHPWTWVLIRGAGHQTEMRWLWNISCVQSLAGIARGTKGPAMDVTGASKCCSLIPVAVSVEGKSEGCTNMAITPLI